MDNAPFIVYWITGSIMQRSVTQRVQKVQLDYALVVVDVSKTLPITD